jgi:hypothetical protein
MTLPAIADLCRALDEYPEDLCVALPGGAIICAQANGLPPSLYALARGLLGQASSALAPLTPIFDIIEAIVGLLECVKAIPDALGPPPDPSKLTSCIPNLVEKVNKLLRLLPAFSVPVLIRDILNALIVACNGAIVELEAIQTMLNNIATARSIGNLSLLEAIDCEERSVAVEMDNLTRAFGAINSMIELLNSLGSLIGFPEIPTIGGSGFDPALAIEGLQTTVETLTVLRDSIPLPPTLAI